MNNPGTGMRGAIRLKQGMYVMLGVMVRRGAWSTLPFAFCLVPQAGENVDGEEELRWFSMTYIGRDGFDILCSFFANCNHIVALYGQQDVSCTNTCEYTTLMFQSQPKFHPDKHPQQE